MLAECGAAGVLCEYKVREFFLQALDNSRFARSVAAFKNDEFPAHTSFYIGKLLADGVVGVRFVEKFLAVFE